MGFWDAVLGRRAQPRPDLDALFALPSAAIGLEVAGYRPTGVAAVGFRAPAGEAFRLLEVEVTQLLDADGGPATERASDEFGYTWLLCRTEPPDLGTLVSDLHAVHTSLIEAGFGSFLLAAVVAFHGPDGQPLLLVYPHKSGRFYPFAPRADKRRDNVVELQVRDLLQHEMPLESDLTRWFALWGAPGSEA
jgi:hypothetical protein